VKTITFLCLLLAWPSVVRSQSPESDKAFADFETARQSLPPAEVNPDDPVAYFCWRDAQHIKLAEQGLAFYTAFPHDPRRWEIILHVVALQPYHNIVDSSDPKTGMVFTKSTDPAAVEAWRAKVQELKAAMEAATDVPPIPHEQIDWNAFFSAFRAAAKAKRNGQPYDFNSFATRFDIHIAKYPDLGETLIQRADEYLGALARNDEAAALAVWQKLAAGCPSEVLRQHASEKLRLVEIMAHPLDMKFTAVDGRPVDLSMLRGKVVLVDFWATWCGPCVAELPNIKRVYATYHDKGFEVVGISLENGKLTPGDSLAEVATKLERAKKVLTDFVTKETLPWPQYFDGLWWKNEISKNYLIHSIPSMFLLDQDGKVVSTNARGPVLESEVRRLLKVDSGKPQS
jgi:thiol-disulfide isomerase/thioredoxin